MGRKEGKERVIILEGLPPDISPEDALDFCQLVVTMLKSGRLTLVPESDEATLTQLAAMGKPRHRLKKSGPILFDEERQARVVIGFGEGGITCRPATQGDLTDIEAIVSLRELQKVPKVNDSIEAERGRLSSARKKKTTIVLHGQPGRETTRHISGDGEVIKTEPDISDYKLSQLTTGGGGLGSKEDRERYKQEREKREKEAAERAEHEREL